MVPYLQEVETMAVIFEARRLPDGAQVLIPRERLPRTCRRADGPPKVAYATRAEAKQAQRKHHVVYRCPNCDSYHRATDRRYRQRMPSIADLPAAA